MSFYDCVMTILDAAVRDAASISELARWCGIEKSSLAKWHNRTNAPRLKDIAPLMDAMGCSIVCKDEGLFKDTSRDEDFIAVPVIKDPDNLEPGYIPPNNIRGWCHVERSYESVSGRSDLIVIQIEDDMMAPAIPRGSMVLVDRSSQADEYGKIFLVRYPHSRKTAIRRVFINDKEHDRKIIFANDNPTYKDPEFFFLKKDYHGDIKRALLGRAIWLRKNIFDL